jgi:G3E family GTPase
MCINGLNMERTRILVLGGFLGAGKTTLMTQLAHALEGKGVRVGVITNDQGDELVDTQLARERGLAVKEVTGGCFCCRFEDLLSTACVLIDERGVDVVMAEAVGSCTDLVATVIRPLQEYYADNFEVAPPVVVLDAKRWYDLGAPNRGRFESKTVFNELASYLFTKQLEEADVIALNKVDLLDDAELARVRSSLENTFPFAQVIPVSGETGEGIEALLGVCERETTGELHGAGSRVLDIDYDQYAAAEAQMGWFNATVGVHAEGDSFQSAAWVQTLLSSISEACRERGWVIGHAKCSVRSSDGWTKASVTRAGDSPWFSGRHEHAASQGEALINVRVEATPDALEQLVRDVVTATDRQAATVSSIDRLECFSPAAPQPTYRLAASGATS